jgi:hypothetical protein
MRFAAVALAVGMAFGAAAPAMAQSTGGRRGQGQPGAARRGAVSRNGQNWEKIPLQHVDARLLALMLGGRVMPTEADLYFGRGGGFGGGFGAFGGPGLGAGGFGGGSANRVYAVPRSNSILYGRYGR